VQNVGQFCWCGRNEWTCEEAENGLLGAGRPSVKGKLGRHYSGVKILWKKSKKLSWCCVAGELAEINI